ALSGNRAPVEIQAQSGLMPRPVITDGQVIPGPVLELFQVAGANLDIAAAVSDEAQADYARGGIDRPSAILLLRIPMRRDDVTLFGLGEEETDGDGERLLRIQLRRVRDGNTFVL